MFSSTRRYYDSLFFGLSSLLLLLLLMQIGNSSAAADADITITNTIDNDTSNTSTSSSYVFLQKFPLQNTYNSIFHTEVLVCLKSGFTTDDQQILDDKISNLQDYELLAEDWWKTKTVNCVEFGYGGAACTERCCGSPHTNLQKNFPLNDHRAVIGNADTTQKSLYIYGSSNLTAQKAYEELCPTDPNHQPCWSNWSGIDYNPLTNNCNTFTSTLLHCIFGLSEKKPNLGPSDMITVTCDKCPLDRNKNKNSEEDDMMMASWKKKPTPSPDNMVHLRQNV